jgi:hypothetical protein
VGGEHLVTGRDDEGGELLIVGGLAGEREKPNQAVVVCPGVAAGMFWRSARSSVTSAFVGVRFTSR